MRTPTAYSLLAIAAACFVSSACSGKHGTTYTNVDPSDGGGGFGSGGDGGSSFGSGVDSGSGSGTGECNATTKSIYVVSEENNSTASRRRR